MLLNGPAKTFVISVVGTAPGSGTGDEPLNINLTPCIGVPAANNPP